MKSAGRQLLRSLRSGVSLIAVSLTLFAFVASAAVAANVVINKLDDLNLGTWNGKKNLKRKTQHCVASDTEEYTIIITGDGPGGAFTAASGAAELPYRVFYKDKPNHDYVQVTSGMPIIDLEARDNPFKCKGQHPRMEVRISANDLALVPAGTYSGIITLMVTPF